MDELGRRLRTTNLNLLPVLHALLHHRSVTTAARDLNMTQSGVSNSLKLLRDHFDDALLVRSGRHFRLTERASQLRDPLDAAMAALGNILAFEPFDPMTSKSRFRIATADYVSAIVAPEVAVILGLEASLMSIQFTAARGRSGYDLQAGDVDLIIGPRQILESIIYPAPALSKSLTIEVVGAEPLVSVAREDNHAIGPDTPLADYLRHPHASFHLDALTHASLEQSFLIKHELEQFERILASDFLVLPMIAARTDCVAVVPASIARLAAKTVPLKTFDPPLNLPNLELAIAWQKRYINDPAHIWFRSLVKRCIMLGIST